MPASERPVTWTAVVHAVGAAAMLGAALWSTGAALALPRWTWWLYARPFDDTVGHRLAGQLARCAAAGGRGVLLLGASSVREAFDEGALERHCPGTRFFNGGLAGGSVDTLAVATLLVERSAARPAGIVVGLHPWMLRSLNQELVARGYSDFFDARDARELLRYEHPSALAGARDELRANLLWPPRRHARQLGRLARAGLHAAHAHGYWGLRRPPQAFELVKDDLRPMPAFRFGDGPGESPQAMLERWRRQGFLEPAAYADDRLQAHLDELLRRLAARTDRLAVVVMPEHSWLAERVSPLAEGRLRAVLTAAAQRGVVVLEHARSLPDTAFFDLAHVNPAGRTAFSQALAPQLAAWLSATRAPDERPAASRRP